MQETNVFHMNFILKFSPLKIKEELWSHTETHRNRTDTPDAKTMKFYFIWWEGGQNCVNLL